MKKICFITTSRADYGTLRELIMEAVNTKKVLVHLIVSGSHISKTFGNTFKEIKIPKKHFLKRVKVSTTNHSPFNVAQSFSDCVKKFSQSLNRIRPNVMVVFGDRYEMFAAAVAAYIIRIPLVHIAGGETTLGSIDEGFRHSISKLSNLHFPVTKTYKKRLIQLGENPNTVFNYGSLNLSKIKNNIYLSKKQLEKKLKIRFLKKNLILTYHPDTVNEKKCIKNLSLVLKSLKTFRNINIIITAPNADVKGVEMINYIKNFIKKNNLKNFIYFKSFGSQVFLSLLKIVDGVVGNSSSGVGEVPFFKIGTVNIGDRQKGRVMLPSIINCSLSKKNIIKSVKKILKQEFKNKINSKISEYGKGSAAKKIAKKIISFNMKKYEKKIFYDINNF